MKSKRTDGRGHWPRGKPRSGLSELEATTCRRSIQRALERISARQVGRLLGVSASTVARISRGQNLPSARVAARSLVSLRNEEA